jgi:Rgg/GadR/MutR family transcriptional activator
LIASDYEARLQEKFIDRFVSYKSEVNIIGLKEILEEEEKLAEKEGGHTLNIIMLILAIKEFDSEFEISNEFMDYLIDSLAVVENWGLYELIVFTFTAKAMDIKISCSMAKELMKRTEFFSYCNTGRLQLIKAFQNVAGECIEQGCLEEAEVFMNHSLTLLTKGPEFFNVNNHFNYMKGCYLYKTGEREEGIRLMKRAISVFENVDYDVTVKIYQDHFDEFVIIDENISG